MARTPSSSKGPRPEQGARLLQLRKAAGLTQIELAQHLQVPQASIAYWEWHEKPPRSEVLTDMAEVFGVDVADLIVGNNGSTHKRPKPTSELQRAFDKVRKLPRRQQKRIVDMIDAMVDQYHRKQSA